jgi:hypothetical protein
MLVSIRCVTGRGYCTTTIVKILYRWAVLRRDLVLFREHPNTTQENFLSINLNQHKALLAFGGNVTRRVRPKFLADPRGFLKPVGSCT